MLRELDEHGVEVYPGSVRYLRAVKDAGLATAVVTASANGEKVIAAGGFADLIDVRVDGLVAARDGLRGKPEPDTFLAGARLLGVRARRRPWSTRTRSPAWRPAGPGDFGYVVGVDRVGQAEALKAAGADVVVTDLEQLMGERGMTEGRATFPIEPWSLTEVGLDHASLGVHESVFALTNGHIGMRGSFEEGEPVVVPGTYLNGFFEERPLPYAEAGYGFPEQGQTMVNVTDGKLIRLLVKDSPLDLDYGEIIDHRRTLDLRAGVLRRVHRVALAGRPDGAGHQHPAGVAGPPVDRRHRVQGRGHRRPRRPLRRRCSPTCWPTRRRATDDDDPRAAAALAKPLQSELAVGRGRRAVLVHRTKRSQLRMAAGMDHVIEIPDTSTEDIEATGDLARYTLAARIPPGGSLQLVKFLAYGWSSRRSSAALRDQVEAALATAKLAGWDRLVREQRELLDQHWDEADVEIEGDDELQQAVRVGMFHVLQAGLRGERQPIPAKGLTGPGYDGHTFWDTETYVLPVLTYTAPHAVRDALRWRHSTLDMARERARVLGLRGAAFPWRTIRGEETLGLLAGRDGGLPHQRRHRRRRRPLLQRHPGRRLRPRLRRRAADRDRPAVGVAGALRRRARLPHRRRHRARRVHRRRRQQRLHEPHGAAEPARGGRGGQAPARRGRPARRRVRRGGRLAAGGRADGGALRHPARRAHAVRRLHPPRGVGLREHAAGALPAAAALPVLRDLPQAGGQAGRPGDGAAPARRRVHPRGEDRQLRLLRGADDAGLVAVGEPAGRRRGGDRAPAAGLRLLGRGGADRPAEPAPQLRARACTSPRWPAAGRSRSPGSAACATTTAS